MTGLVDLIFPDGIFALDAIKHIGEARKVDRQGYDTRVREIVFTDGTKRAMGVAFVDRVLRRPMQLIPAEAGTFALHAWSDSEERGVNKCPVIAWALCVDGDVRPVTAQGVNDGDMMHDGEGYVLMPNGTVQSIGEHVDPVWFDTLEEYCEYIWQALDAKRLASAAKRPTQEGAA